MLCRAPNESITRPYMGTMTDANPNGDINLAHLLHLIDLVRVYPNQVAYTEKQLIRVYEERGIKLWDLTLPL